MSRKLNWEKNNRNKLVATAIVYERLDETVEDIIYEKEFAEMLERKEDLDEFYLGKKYVEPTAEEIEEEKNRIRVEREKRAYRNSGRAERDKQHKKIIEEREKYNKKVQERAKEDVELSNRQQISKIRQELTKDVPVVELPKYNKTKTIEVVRLSTRKTRNRKPDA